MNFVLNTKVFITFFFLSSYLCLNTIKFKIYSLVVNTCACSLL
jgi:hypothetical protein